MIKLKPYFLFLLASILFIALRFFAVENSLTANFYDTYYVTSYNDSCNLFVILYGLSFLTYFVFDLLKIQFSKKVLLFYFFILSILTIILFYLNFLSNKFELKYRALEDIINPPNFNKYMIFSILLIISSQIFFIINIFVIITKKLRLPRACK